MDLTGNKVQHTLTQPLWHPAIMVSHEQPLMSNMPKANSLEAATLLGDKHHNPLMLGSACHCATVQKFCIVRENLLAVTNFTLLVNF